MKRRFPARAWPIFGAIRYRAAVRCDECGHSLAGVPSGAPCSECGVVTPDARRTLPPVNVAAAIAEYAWPFAVIAVGGALGFGLAGRGNEGSLMVGLLVTGVGFCLVPVAAAFTTVLLMLRMPRRARWAPLVLLVPRIVAVPVLIAMAVTFVAIVMIVGACVVGFPFLRS